MIGLLALVIVLEVEPRFWWPPLISLGGQLGLPLVLRRFHKRKIEHAMFLATSLVVVAYLGEILPLLAWLPLLLAILHLWLDQPPLPALIGSVAASTTAAYLYSTTPARAFEAAGFFVLTIALGWLLAQKSGHTLGARSEATRLRQQVGHLLALRRASYEIRVGLGHNGLEHNRVVHALAREAQKMTGASHVLVISLTSERQIGPWTTQGYTPAQAERLLQAPRSILRRVLRTGSHALVTDVGRDRDHFQVVPHGRSLLIVPITHRGSTVGAIQLESPEPAYFLPEQLGTLQELAEEGGWALHLSTLLQEGESRLAAAEEEKRVELAKAHQSLSKLEGELEQLHSLQRVSAQFGAGGELDEGLRTLAQELADLLAADAVTVWLRDAGGRLHCRAALGTAVAQLQDARWEPGPGLHGWVLRSGEALLVSDLSTERRTTPQELAIGARSAIFAPLKVGAEIRGCLSAFRLEPEAAFTPEALERLTSVAHGIAPMVSAMHLQVSSMASAQRLKALEGLYRELTGEPTAEGVFRAFVREAPALLPYDWAGLVQPAGSGRLRVLSVVGQGRIEESYGESAGSLFGQVLEEGRAVVLDDLAAAEGLRLEESLVAAGMRSLLALPLVHQQRPIAVLALASQTAGAYGEESLTTLEGVPSVLGAGLALAERHERRLTETQSLQRQGSGLASMLRLGNALRSQLNVPELLEETARAIRDGLGYGVAQIYLLDPDGGPEAELKLVVSEGVSAAVLPARVPELVALMREEFRVSHSYLIPHHRHEPGGAPPAAPHLWQSGDLFIVPLRQSGGQLLGTLRVDEPPDGRRPNREAVELIELFAAQAAVAILNARLYEEVQRLAITDALLGIYNRRFFNQRIVEECSRALRHQHPLSLIIVEVDRLKLINDQLGHQAGDQALQAVAKVLRELTRSTDIVCRYGGDEVAIILPETEATEAAALAERLRSQVASLRIDTKPLSVSLGVASYPAHAQRWEDLLRQADEACYRAKEVGRNRVQVALGPPLRHELQTRDRTVS